MGQKIHPLGLRLGVTQKHRSNWCPELYYDSHLFPKAKQYEPQSFYQRLMLEDRLVRNYLFKHYPKAKITDIIIERVETKMLLKTKKPLEIMRVKVHAIKPKIIVSYKSKEDCKKSIRDLQMKLEALCQKKRDQENLPELMLALRVFQVQKPNSEASYIADLLVDKLENRVPFRSAIKQVLKEVAPSKRKRKRYRGRGRGRGLSQGQNQGQNRSQGRNQGRGLGKGLDLHLDPLCNPCLCLSKGEASGKKNFSGEKIPSSVEPAKRLKRWKPAQNAEPAKKSVQFVQPDKPVQSPEPVQSPKLLPRPERPKNYLPPKDENKSPAGKGGKDFNKDRKNFAFAPFAFAKAKGAEARAFARAEARAFARAEARGKGAQKDPSKKASQNQVGNKQNQHKDFNRPDKNQRKDFNRPDKNRHKDFNRPDKNQRKDFNRRKNLGFGQGRPDQDHWLFSKTQLSNVFDKRKKPKRPKLPKPFKGLKIQIAGRLNGAEIARTEWMRDKGRVPLQTLRADIGYASKTAKTIFGMLGIKVWVFKEEKI